MGRNTLEQKSGERPAPATEQKSAEISLAGELREMMDEILEKANPVSFNFEGREFYVISSNTCGVSLVENGWLIFGSVKASLLTSEKWPVPEWTPTTAKISKDTAKYTIEVKGHKFNQHDCDYGIHLVLDGTYPRISNIVPARSLEAAEEERRKLRGEFIPPDPIPSLLRGEVEIPARDGRLRSRVDRLKYGIFLASRIKAASSGEKLFTVG